MAQPMKVSPVLTRNISVHSSKSGRSLSPISMKGKSRDGRRIETAAMRRNKSSHSESQSLKRQHENSNPKLKKYHASENNLAGGKVKFKPRDNDIAIMTHSKSHSHDREDKTYGQSSVSPRSDKGISNILA